jgi:hypothetical protein
MHTFTLNGHTYRWWTYTNKWGRILVGSRKLIHTDYGDVWQDFGSYTCLNGLLIAAHRETARLFDTMLQAMIGD